MCSSSTTSSFPLKDGLILFSLSNASSISSISSIASKMSLFLFFFEQVARAVPDLKQTVLIGRE